MKILSLLIVILLIVGCNTEESNSPKIVVNPTSKDFGTVFVGSTSSSISFSVKNEGSETLRISNIIIRGDNPNDFVLIASPPIELEENKNSSFSVTFKPTDIGLRKATVEITHNAPESLTKITLNGTGEFKVIYEDDFSVSGLWSVSHGTSSNGNASWLYDIGNNITGGDGRFIIADSKNTPGFFDEYISSQLINCATYFTGTIKLEFDGNYQDGGPVTVHQPFNDYAAVIVYDWIHFTWRYIDRYYDDWNINGEHKSYDITSYARGNPMFKIGFYYFGADDGWFAVDNVKLVHIP
ncbi:MAG: choice-of-anchor D domain-containing protein [Planctomycetes bacterium]|nr:choice-of-anchor D domain-containing protein [Planctomycetota bacterium]